MMALPASQIRVLLGCEMNDIHCVYKRMCSLDGLGLRCHHRRWPGCGLNQPSTPAALNALAGVVTATGTAKHLGGAAMMASLGLPVLFCRQTEKWG